MEFSPGTLDWFLVYDIQKIPHRITMVQNQLWKWAKKA